MNPENQVETVQSTVAVLEWRSGQSVRSLQPIYPLTHVEFMRLKGAPLRTETLSINFLFAWLAFVLTLAPRFIDHFVDPAKDGPTKSEWWIAGVGLFVIVAIWAIGFALEDPRKETFKKLDKFFRASEEDVSDFVAGRHK